jgi:hypothetical protein
LQFWSRELRLKFRDLFFCGASKKKFVEIALAEQFGFPCGSPAFCESSRGERVRSGTTEILLARPAGPGRERGCGEATGIQVKRARGSATAEEVVSGRYRLYHSAMNGEDWPLSELLNRSAVAFVKLPTRRHASVLQRIQKFGVLLRGRDRLKSVRRLCTTTVVGERWHAEL